MATRGYFPRDNVTVEGQVFTDGDGDDSKIKFNNCPKGSCHQDYIPVDQIKMEDLPDWCQTKEFMDGLKLRCDLTVKVVVSYTSMNRPLKYIDSDKDYPYSSLRGSHRATRTGTGYIMPDSIRFSIKGKPCPCSICVQTGKSEMGYLDLSVITATHLVFDNDEALNSTFVCFYDSVNTVDAKCLYGRSVTDPDELKRCVNDCCVVNCITHDSELIKKLLKVAEKREIVSLSSSFITRGVIISHPHGLSKQVSFGNILSCEVHKDPRLPNDVLYEFGNDAKCRVQNSVQMSPSCLPPTTNPSLGHHLKSAESQEISTEEKTCEKHTLAFDTVVSPGKEFSLPPGMTFKLPVDSACFCTFQLPINYNTKLWVKFPTGTEFFLPEGTNLPLPPETEFCWRKGKATANNKACVYVVYDIATCPGSSGAMVFRCNNSWGIFPHFPHCGAEEDGFNRSSNIMLFCYYETWMAFPSITREF